MIKKLLVILVIFASFLFLTSFCPRQSFALDCSAADLNELQKLVCNPFGELVLNPVLDLSKEHLFKFTGDVAIGVLTWLFSVIAGPPFKPGEGTVPPMQTPSMIPSQMAANETLYPGLTNVVGLALVQTVSHPPTVNHLAFAKSVLANNIVNQQAYALKGTEYLDPIKDLWNSFRDVAYGLFVVAIALVALGLMMRTQISPRVTITLANSLPRLFLALFLITFSFPIIGLLIDLGAVLKGVIDNVMQVNPSDTSLVIGHAFVGTIIGNFFYVILGSGGITGSLASIGLAPGVAAALGALLGIVIALIFCIAILITYLRLFFVVLIRWAGIFVGVILSPLALFWSAIPGQEESAIKLFKSILINVLTLPVIYFFILLAFKISTMPQWIPAPESLGFVPIQGLGLDPLTFPINSLVSLGILFTAVKAPDALEEILNIRPLFKGGGGPAEVFRKVPIIGGLAK